MSLSLSSGAIRGGLWGKSPGSLLSKNEQGDTQTQQVWLLTYWYKWNNTHNYLKRTSSPDSKLAWLHPVSLLTAMQLSQRSLLPALFTVSQRGRKTYSITRCWWTIKLSWPLVALGRADGSSTTSGGPQLSNHWFLCPLVPIFQMMVGVRSSAASRGPQILQPCSREESLSRQVFLSLEISLHFELLADPE